MWVRGLKLSPAIIAMLSIQRSHPMWVRGLKLPAHQVCSAEGESHPMWVRGLKLQGFHALTYTCASHPMWVRGLKLAPSRLKHRLGVAPHVGAWIETLCS